MSGGPRVRLAFAGSRSRRSLLRRNGVPRVPQKSNRSRVNQRRPSRPRPPFKLEKGDHICIVGNTLADGCSTTAGSKPSSTPATRDTTSRSATSASPATRSTLRLRSADFGTPDQWLAGECADPAAEGARRQERGVPEPVREDEHQGRRDLRLLRLQRVVRGRGRAAEVQGRPRSGGSSTRWRRSTTAIRAAARAVLADRARGPQVAEPARAAVEINKNLELYTEAMGEVAKANGVRFVDLFTPTQSDCSESRSSR